MGKSKEVDIKQLTAEISAIAAKEGAKYAMATLAKEQERQRQDRRKKRLHNTRLLLRNYRTIKVHAEKAVYDASQLDDSSVDILDLMWDPTCGRSDYKIESILKSAAKTAIILKHVDDMLQAYESLCQCSNKPEDMRRWRVIKAMYLDVMPQTAEKLAEQENIYPRTVYKDVDSAVEKLSTLFFGIDWLDEQQERKRE